MAAEAAGVMAVCDCGFWGEMGAMGGAGGFKAAVILFVCNAVSRLNV